MLLLFLETRNGLTCIARRIAYEDKRVGLNKVEQFTTRIDQDWKVVDLDTRYDLVFNFIIHNF